MQPSLVVLGIEVVFAFFRGHFLLVFHSHFFHHFEKIYSTKETFKWFLIKNYYIIIIKYNYKYTFWFIAIQNASLGIVNSLPGIDLKQSHSTGIFANLFSRQVAKHLNPGGKISIFSSLTWHENWSRSLGNSPQNWIRVKLYIIY